MNEEQPKPKWPAPRRGKYYASGEPLTFVGTIADMDIYQSAMPGHYVSVMHQHQWWWKPQDVRGHLGHSSPPPTRRARAVQKHLRILEALMR